MIFKRKYFYASILLIIAVISIFVLNNVRPNASSLSQDEIEELRENYPLYPGVPDHLSMKVVTLDDAMKTAETFVFAEVIEQLPEYTINLIDDSNSAEGKIHEKGKEFGMTDTANFIQYKIKVIEDLFESNIFKNNQPEEIIIAVSSEFKDVEPELKPGMKIITPIMQGKGKHQGKYLYYKYGLYYVTDDEYVLAAYDEGSKTVLTGKQIEHAKSALRKMHKMHR